MESARQFRLLLWKNWLLQKRKVILTLFELLLPTIFVLILLIVKQEVVEVVDVTEPTSWPHFRVEDQLPARLVPPGLPGTRWRIPYSPDITATQNVMSRVGARLGVIPQGFKSEESIMKYMQTEEATTYTVLGAVCFKENFKGNDTFNEDIVISIRMPAEQYGLSGGGVRLVRASDWLTSIMYPSTITVGPRSNSTTGGSPGYFREGFLHLQRALGLAVTQEINASAPVDDIDILMKRHPFPPYVDDPFVAVLQIQLPGVVLLSFIVIAANICKDVVLEKERKLKETMKMMGLKNYLHWSAWFVKYLIFAIIICLILTTFLCIDPSGENRAIIKFSDPTVIYVFLLTYAITTIMFCFAISTFFTKATTGAAAGVILFLLTYAPYLFLQWRYETMSTSQKFGTATLHNVAMAFGCLQLSRMEGAGIGLHWNNLNIPINNDDPFTMMYVILILIMDSFVYIMITWYFDAILPGDFGIPKPWYFPFTKWYWCGRDIEPVEVSDIEDFDYGKNGDFFERPSSNLKAGIQIRHLRKVFNRIGVSTAAVKDLVLDMYEGQITALLGHNGAGKTTTMFMLTGFIPPSNGTAYVNGYDIRTDIDLVRKNLGLCPQHDVLFDNMTVKEHLIFIGELKGLKGNKLTEEVEKMVGLVYLEDKANSRAKSLSGGMKRKLSVSMALIADSKFVILDEPTSGMDPEARRQTWDILQNERENRTIILSTHFMDEADLLGDRIAIMADGVLQCCGSSLFLKGKYGVGYHLVMVKEATCDVKAMTDLIEKYVPEAMIESNISSELSYLLPKESCDKFEPMFTYIEKNKKELGISSFGASVTTLEEVFLKVGENLDDDLKMKLQKGTKNSTVPSNGVVNNGFVPDSKDTSDSELEKFKGEVSLDEDTMDTASYQLCSTKKVRSRSVCPIDDSNKELNPTFGTSFHRNTGFRHGAQQFKAMFIKRIIHSMRNILVTLVQIIVPLFFTTLACLVLETFPGPRDPTPLNLALSYFTDPQVPYILKNGTMDDFAEALQGAYLTSIAGQANGQNVNEIMGGTAGMKSYLVNIAEENLQTYIQDYIIAGTFKGAGFSDQNISTSVIGHFNNQAYHSPGISLTYVQDAILKLFGGSKYSISTINHPLPRRSTTQATDELNTGFVISYVVSYWVFFGMAFLVSSFVIFLINERVSKSKHVQFVSGVHLWNFWVSTFLWDFTNYLIPALLLLAVFAGFDIEPYYKGNNGGYMILLFVMYAWAVLPFIYLLSFAFDVASLGYVWITVINLFTGSISVLVIMVLRYPDLETMHIAEALEWVFHAIFPNYSFSIAMTDLFTNYQGITVCTEVFESLPIDRNRICAQSATFNITNPCCPEYPEICGVSCIRYNENYIGWETPGIGRGICFLGLQGFIFFSVLFVSESGFFRKQFSRAVSGSYVNVSSDNETIQMSLESMQSVEDTDVKAERERIKTSSIEFLKTKDSLVLLELKKYYGNFLAVNGLTVGIPQGECFGLLGVNGAGKTTTFKMMTGDELISSGEAYLSGFSAKDEIIEVHKRLGYCPQFDALIAQMTVRETLQMFGRLRGVHEHDLAQVVQNLIKSLLLSEHAEKRAGHLSGGNKRKLSTAIAIIGDPPIVFLDEPTTGMDPVARRLLWDTLTKVRMSGRTLILTSHSMEECEALCTRIAIMVNGQFKCLGSTQHLKNKFGEGYTLMAKIKTTGSDKEASSAVTIESQTQALRTFIENQFPGCEMKDAHLGLVHYQIKSAEISWGEVFGTMERAKEEYHIEDYSVSQTTLDQVFINFARAQVEPRDTSMTCKVKCSNCCRFFCCNCC